MNGTLRPAFDLAGTLGTISDFMYTYVLVALLIGVGLYFFIRTRANEEVQADADQKRDEHVRVHKVRDRAESAGEIEGRSQCSIHGRS